MKKTVLAMILVSLAAGSATGCSKKFQREWDRQMSERERQEQSHDRHHGRHHNRDHDEDSDEGENANTFGAFRGSYDATFDNGQKGARIRVTDYDVYIGDHKASDTNKVGNTLVARDGYATYTIKANGRGSWTDPDAGSSGSIRKN